MQKGRSLLEGFFQVACNCILKQNIIIELEDILYWICHFATDLTRFNGVLPYCFVDGSGNIIVATVNNNCSGVETALRK